LLFWRVEVHHDRSIPASSRGQLWGVIAAFVALSALLAIPAGLELAWLDYLDVLIGIAVVAALAYLRPAMTSEPIRRLCDFFETLTLLGALCIAAAFASIGLAGMTTGYADPTLAIADSWIGFEWEGAYRFVEGRPWAQSLGRTAYRSIFWTPMFLLAGLCVIGRAATARCLVVTYAVALVFTLALFALVPAAGPLTHYGLASGTYVPLTNEEQVRLIEAVRAAEAIIIHKEDLIGVISFPSFHAASALIFVWAGWHVPLARLYFLGVSLAMLAATPVEGNHYLIDLFGGAIVAIAAILTTRAMSARNSESRTARVVALGAIGRRGDLKFEPPEREAA
jgi:hypothetical protein